MLALEHFRPEQYHHQPYGSGTNSYQSTTMDSFDFNAMSHLPYSYYDPLATSLEVPFGDPYAITRSASASSTRRSEYDIPPTLLSSESVASGPSSAVTSPNSGFVHMDLSHDTVFDNSVPSFMSGQISFYDTDVAAHQLDTDLGYPIHDQKLSNAFVDPVQVTQNQDAYYNANQQYSPTRGFSQLPQQAVTYSSAPSPVSLHAFSPPVTQENYGRVSQRCMSTASHESVHSPRGSVFSDEENCEKARCLECGKIYKDMKAHVLTHKDERPEKCPLASCEYSRKGFARKYDKNRHTLTHYKGTMICGFCPGSGSPGEKLFNRADVFKRHLTQVHGVEQNPPNSRKRTPSSSTKQLASYCSDATGKCSTCPNAFENAQEFYEHLDECVLSVVQREAPSEAINARRLAEVACDTDVQDTFERHMIKTEEGVNPLAEIEQDEDDDEAEDDDDDEENDDDDPNTKHDRMVMKTVKASGARVVIGGHIAKQTKTTKKGMTWSKGGVSLFGKGRKRRKQYPPSWGLAADKMKMKKRVLCVYDGPHRLLKDDMMLHKEYEVRLRLPDSEHYVTDLDVEILKRANAYHDAPAEEKREWFSQQDLSLL